MGVINFNIDNQRKDKIEKIMRKKGIKDISQFIIDAIDAEIDLQMEFLDDQTSHTAFSLKENEIIEYLTKISSQLKKIPEREKKIDVLVELNDFLRENKDTIKEKFPDLLVSILNSL